MTGRLFLSQKPLFHGGHAAVDQQQAGVVLRHQREAVQTQMALTFKKAQVLFAQFIQTGPLHKFSLLNCPWRLHVRFFMMLWQRGRQAQKTKTASIPIKGRRLCCSKLRGTTQIAKDKLSPAAFGALTLRSVRFAFAGSSGVARNGPDRNALQPAGVLSGRWCAHFWPHHCHLS